MQKGNHTQLTKASFDTLQKHFILPETRKPSTSQGDGDVERTLKLNTASHTDLVTNAEILWVLKVASDGYTFRSCDGHSDMFKVMFPCATSKDFSMSRTKASYMLSDGLGP